MDQILTNLPWIGAGIALLTALLIQRKVMAAPAGNETMQSLAIAIQDGARAFLVTEYKLLTIFVIVAGTGLYFLPEGGGLNTMTAFFSGAFASALAGLIILTLLFGQMPNYSEMPHAQIRITQHGVIPIMAMINSA